MVDLSDFIDIKIKDMLLDIIRETSEELFKNLHGHLPLAKRDYISKELIEEKYE